MKEQERRTEANINQLLETFNADETELMAFLENPKHYLEKLGATDLSGMSDTELRQMVQNHVER